MTTIDRHLFFLAKELGREQYEAEHHSLASGREYHQHRADEYAAMIRTFETLRLAVKPLIETNNTTAQ